MAITLNKETESWIKCLEVRDVGTFIPVICIKPVPDNEAQRYLLRRDGYSCNPNDPIIIMIDAQCRGAAYDPYDWDSVTKKQAHHFIQRDWDELKDSDVIDIEFLIGAKPTKKLSERATSER